MFHSRELNQLDDQQSTSSKRPMIEAEMQYPAINIKQAPPTANDVITTSLLPEEDLSFDNPGDPSLDPEERPPFL